MRYAKTEYWLAKEERAEQERKEREYEITQEDIDDIKYREERENGELDYIFPPLISETIVNGHHLITIFL